MSKQVHLTLLEAVGEDSLTSVMVAAITTAEQLLRDLSAFKSDSDRALHYRQVESRYDQWYEETVTMFGRFCSDGSCDGFEGAVSTSNLHDPRAVMTSFLDQRIRDLQNIQGSLQADSMNNSGVYGIPCPW
jgi:hypothetical protein